MPISDPSGPFPPPDPPGPILLLQEAGGAKQTGQRDKDRTLTSGSQEGVCVPLGSEGRKTAETL